jgi:hypothetical protein
LNVLAGVKKSGIIHWKKYGEDGAWQGWWNMAEIFLKFKKRRKFLVTKTWKKKGLEKCWKNVVDHVNRKILMLIIPKFFLFEAWIWKVWSFIIIKVNKQDV